MNQKVEQPDKTRESPGKNSSDSLSGYAIGGPHYTNPARPEPASVTNGRDLQFSNLYNDRQSHENPSAAAEQKSDAVRRQAASALSTGSIHDEFGVNVKKSAKVSQPTYEYHLRANGEDKILFSTKANGEGLQEAQRKLRDKVDEQKGEIERKYGVKFTPAGEKIGNQSRIDRNGEEVETDTPITSREPTLPELVAVDSALKKSEPTFRLGNKALKLEFANQDAIKDVPAAGAEYHPPQPGESDSAVLKFFPGALKLPPTERDVKVKDKGGQADSLEAVIDHELGHSSENNIATISPEDAQYKRDMGWVPLKSNPKEDSDWALRGKDGRLYQPVPTPAGVKWFPIEGNKGYDEQGNYQGRYIDRSGKPLQQAGKADLGAIDSQVHSLDRQQIMDRADIRPSSIYNEEPSEEMAEGLRNFRINAESRKNLLQTSPGLYAAAAKLDQQEIDKFYGPGKKVRLPDGAIADDDEISRKRVKDFAEGRK